MNITTHGRALLVGSLHQAVLNAGIAALQIAEAQLAERDDLLQSAAEQIAKEANRALVLANTIAEQVSVHRRRSRLNGVR